MMKMTIFLMMTVSIMMMFLTHPISINIILLIQIILMSLLKMIFIKFSWFSYIMFIIMVGGLMIIFTYMTSIASNEKMNFDKMNFLIISIMIYLTMLIMNFSNKESMEMYKTNNFFLKFFNYPMNLIIMFMFFYLFITLIACVKITNHKYGPLRQKF